MEATVENRDMLRLVLAEQIPIDGLDHDTRFTDEQIDTLLLANNSMVSAAADGWAIKAGLYSHFIDISESGSDRKLNQLFKNAERMMKHYAELAKVDADLLLAATTRVGARAAAWGEHAGNRKSLILTTKEAMYVRVFADHRWFPAIKG
jgi:hypothetical protein